MAPQTVLVVGSTGRIGTSAIHGALAAGLNVLAVVRNQASAAKLQPIFGDENMKRITTVEADVMSDTGVQSVVEKVRVGKLPAFQHVFTAVGNDYSPTPLVDVTTERLRAVMRGNFEPNFFVYRATIPYFLSQPDAAEFTWTMCTGAQGDFGERALPAMSQGALFSMAKSAFRATKDANIRVVEQYLAFRVEHDDEAAVNGTVPASVFGRNYTHILERKDIKACRVRVDKPEDIDVLKFQYKGE